MQTVVVVIHLMVIIALVALVLMQRSEGGALGIGGSGNFLSSRSQGNVLTRSTAFIAAAFFLTSIVLGVLSRFGEKPTSILEHVQSGQAPISAPAIPAGGAPAAPLGNAPATGGQLLPSGAEPAAPATPGAAPAAPATGGGAAPVAPVAPQVPTSQ